MLHINLRLLFKKRLTTLLYYHDYTSLFSPNSVCVSRRSKEMFGWEPKERTFEEFVAGNVDAYLAITA